VPGHSISYFPWLACGQSAGLMDEAKNFFLDPGRRTQGLELEFQEAASVVSRRVKLKEKESDRIRRFLRERASRPPEEGE
jgi:hypothetical protein